MTRSDAPPLPLRKPSMASAGARAMKGEPMRATTAMSMMALRHPGSAAAKRAPSAMRPKMPTSVGGRGRSGREMIDSAPTTAPNDSALTAKAQAGEPTTRTSPARAGPITRPRLNCADDSDTAPRRSSGGTRSGIMAW